MQKNKSVDTPFDYIFIDTSVFKGSQFFLEGGCVYRMFDFAERGYVRIIMPAITEKEWQRHFDEGMKLKFGEIGRKARLLGASETEGFLEKYSDISKDYERLVKSSFRQHLDRAEVIRLPFDYPSDRLKRIFEKYFAKEKPFGPDGKKNEFPDAFVLMSLEKYAEENGLDRIIVFAKDNDMSGYASEVLVCKDATEYLNELTTTMIPAYEKEKVAEDIGRLNGYLEAEPEKLIVQIHAKVEEFLSDVSKYNERFNYADIDEVSVDKLVLGISVQGMEIHSVGEEVINAVFFVGVHASVSVHHFNEEESIWDSEDKKYINQVYSTTTLKLSSAVPVTIDFYRAQAESEQEPDAELVDVDCNGLHDAINDDGWHDDEHENRAVISSLNPLGETLKRMQRQFQMPERIQDAMSSAQSVQQLFAASGIVRQMQEIQAATSGLTDAFGYLQQMSMPAHQLIAKMGTSKEEVDGKE